MDEDLNALKEMIEQMNARIEADNERYSILTAGLQAITKRVSEITDRIEKVLQIQIATEDRHNR